MQLPAIFPAYISHFLNAVDSHSLHSPFVFRFYNEVIRPSRHGQGDPAIENCRRSLRSNGDHIRCPELGAGSRISNSSERAVAEIAKYGISTLKTCRLLEHTVDFHKPKNVIELGTSLGIGTMYLASEPNTKVNTFEGCNDLASIALSNFEKCGFVNIEVHKGPIENTLPLYLEGNTLIDLVFIDANHRKGALLDYFELIHPKMSPRSICIIDDIRWSVDMYEGWNVLTGDDRINLSLDLGRIGLLIKEPEYPKQHFNIWF